MSALAIASNVTCPFQDQYIAQILPEYRGHPFIEPLGNTLDKRAVYAAVKRQPPIDASLRSADDHIRRHAIGQMFGLFVPLPRINTEYMVMDRMIRRGYLARIPLPVGFWKSLDASMDRVREDIKLIRVLKSTPSDSIYVGCSSDLNAAKVGASGCGKTSSSEMCLSLFPQVVPHGSYLGHKINRKQVVWLRLQAPHHGSMKDLCRAFFRELDRLLDTEYTVLFGRGDVETMLDHMIRLAAVHGVGLLVIDEVQEFSLGKSGGKDAIVGFLLRLTNTIGVPVLLIGTPKISKVLFGQMRHIRRSTGLGLPEWGPLEHSEEEWSDPPRTTEWSLFISELWKYQYTRTPVPLEKGLSEVLYDECQGIPDFAKKVYFLVQDRLIATGGPKGKEAITAQAIRSVARDYLKPARRVLQALREKNRDVLDELDDIELQPIQNNQTRDQVTLSLPPDDSQGTGQEELCAPSKATTSTSPAVTTPMPAALHTPPGPPEQSLLGSIVGKEAIDGSEAYTRLRDAGFVKPGTEFWVGK